MRSSKAFRNEYALVLASIEKSVVYASVVIDPLPGWKLSLCVFTGRIPSVPDPDILRTYLANKDAATIPKIPVRPRAVGLQTKMGMHIASPDWLYTFLNFIELKSSSSFSHEFLSNLFGKIVHSQVKI